MVTQQGGNRMSISSEIKESTRELTDVLQEACNKHVHIARSVVVAKSKLQSCTEENKKAQDIYEKNVQIHNIIDKKILHIEDYLSSHQMNALELMQTVEKISCAKDTLQWQQVKAMLIHASERAQHRKHQQTMEHYSKQILSSNAETSTSIKAVSRQQEETLHKKKDMMKEKKITLELAIKQKICDKQPLADQVFKSERENLVLQKRNNAILLRLRRQLQESECRHNHMQSRLDALQQISKQKATMLTQQKEKYSSF